MYGPYDNLRLKMFSEAGTIIVYLVSFTRKVIFSITSSLQTVTSSSAIFCKGGQFICMPSHIFIFVLGTGEYFPTLRVDNFSKGLHCHKLSLFVNKNSTEGGVLPIYKLSQSRVIPENQRSR